MKARLLRWFKRFLRVTAFTVLGLGLLIAAVIALLHTDFGRRVLADQVSNIASGILTGELQIGKIEGSVLGSFSIQQVVLHDAEGREAVRVERISVDWDPWALTELHVHVLELEVEAPVVRAVQAEDGTLNLATLVRPGDPAPPEPEAATSGGVTVQLDDIQLSDGAFSLDAPSGALVRLEDLALSGSFGLVGAQLRAELASLTGRMVDRDLSVSIATKASLDGSRAEVDSLDAAIGQVKLHLAKAHWDLDSNVGRAVLETSAPPGALGRALGMEALAVGFALTATVSRASADAEWQAGLTGDISGAVTAMRVSAGPSFERASVRLRVQALDPQAIHTGAPRARLDVAVDGEVELSEPSRPNGHAEVQVSGWVQPGVEDAPEQIALDVLTVRATARDGLVNTQLSLGAADGTLEGSAELRPFVMPLRLNTARLSAKRLDLKVFALPGLPLGGRLSLDAQASGPLSNLAVNANASGERLRVAGLRIGELEVEARATGVPDMPVGTASISASGLSFEDNKLGALAANARFSDAGRRIDLSLTSTGATMLPYTRLTASVTRSAEETLVKIAELRVATPAATWIAEDAEVALSAQGRLFVRKLVLASELGSIEAEGNLDPSAPFTAPSDVRLSVKALDFLAARGLGIVDDMPLMGRLSLNAQLAKKKRGSPALTLSGHLERAAYGAEMTPLEATLDAKLVDRAFSLSLVATSTALGSVTVSGTIDTPVRITDPAEWKKLGFRALQEAQVSFAPLRLSEVAALAGDRHMFSGTLEGTIALRDRGSEISTSLRIFEVTAPELHLPVSAKIEGSTHPKNTTLELEVKLGEHPAITASAELEVGASTLAREGLSALWPANGRLDISIDQLPLRSVDQALAFSTSQGAPGGPEMDGHLSLVATFRREGAQVGASASLLARQVVLRKGTPAIDASWEAKIAEGRLTTSFELDAGPTARLELDAEVDVPGSPFDPAAWAALDSSDIHGIDLELHRLELRTLALHELLPREVGGQLTARVHLGEGLKIAQAIVSLRGYRVLPELQNVDVELFLEQRPEALHLSVATFLGGDAFLAAEADLSATLAKVVDDRGVDPETLVVGAQLTIPEFQMARAFSNEGMQSKVAGTMSLATTLKGRLTEPEGNLEFQLNDASLAGISFSKFGIEAELGPEAITVDARATQHGGGDLSLQARMGLDSESAPVEAKLEARAFDLGFLTALVSALQGPAAAIDGQLDATATLSGERGAPELSGHIGIERGRILLPGAPALDSMKATADLAGDTLTMELDARSGGGKVKATASAKLASVEEQTFSAKITTDNVKVAAGPIVVEIDSRITVTGERNAEGTSAEMVIDDMSVKLPEESVADLHPVHSMEDVVFVEEHGEALPRAAVVTTSSSSTQLLTLDISVKTAKPIRVRGLEVEALLNVDLRAKSSRFGLRTTGLVEVASGRVELFGREYEISRGTITMEGKIPPNPRLDIRLTYDFDEATYLILVYGTARNPELRFASDPAIFDQAELTRFFLGGSPDAAEDDRALGQQAAGAATGILFSQVQSTLRKALPIDTLEVELSETGEPVPGAVTVGKWLTRSLFVAYTYRFEAADVESANEATLRYRLSAEWLFEAVFGLNGNGAGDILWVKRF